MVLSVLDSTRGLTTASATMRASITLAPSLVGRSPEPALPTAVTAIPAPSMPGVGSDRVQLGKVWPQGRITQGRCDANATDHTFSTRSGPPRCSPPV